LGGVGDRARVGPFVEIQRGVQLGADCKIQNHPSACEGVTIRDRVFGRTWRRLRSDWDLQKTLVEEESSIGSAAAILRGVRIGAGARRRGSSCHIRCRSRARSPLVSPRVCLQRTASPKV